MISYNFLTTRFKNQKRAITRRYNARFFKVLEITRAKPKFPTDVLRLLFNFAKSMEVGEKKNTNEITATIVTRKMGLHKGLLTLMLVREINVNVREDPEWNSERCWLLRYFVERSWPLSKKEQDDSGELVRWIQEKYVDGAPPLFTHMLKTKGDRLMFKPEFYANDKDFKRLLIDPLEQAGVINVN